MGFYRPTPHARVRGGLLYKNNLLRHQKQDDARYTRVVLFLVSKRLTFGSYEPHELDNAQVRCWKTETQKLKLENSVYDKFYRDSMKYL